VFSSVVESLLSKEGSPGSADTQENKNSVAVLGGRGFSPPGWDF
jgi:hypothetical protein